MHQITVIEPTHFSKLTRSVYTCVQPKNCLLVLISKIVWNSSKKRFIIHELLISASDDGFHSCPYIKSPFDGQLRSHILGTGTVEMLSALLIEH